MKRILLIMVAVIAAICSLSAAQTTIMWNSAMDWTEINSGISITHNGITISGIRGAGTNVPTINFNTFDARFYAKAEVTVSCATEKLKMIKFNLSAKGKDRLPELAVTSGAVEYRRDNGYTVWTGSSETVTFTVGDIAVHGISSTSAGQLCFSSVDVITGNDDTELTATPEISPNGGTIESGSKVTLSCKTEGAKIYYTLDDSEPAETSTEYTAPFALTEDCSVKAIAISNGIKSLTATARFFISQPGGDPNECTFDFSNPQTLDPAQTVTGEVNVNGIVFKNGDVKMMANIGSGQNCRLWNSNGKIDLRIYTNATLTISSGNSNLQTIVFDGRDCGDTRMTANCGTFTGHTWTADDHVVKEVVFTALKGVKISTAKITTTAADPNATATPVITPDGGTYVSGETVPVTITSPTEGAEIRYKIDEGNYLLYQGSFDVNNSCTVTAYAVKDGSESASSKAVFVFKPAETLENPKINPAHGQIFKGCKIAMRCKTSNAEIRYTTDGTEPTRDSRKYTEPITINENCTVMAIAVKNGSVSEIEETSFTVTDLNPDNVLFDFSKPGISNPNIFVPAPDAAEVIAEDEAFTLGRITVDPSSNSATTPCRIWRSEYNNTIDLRLYSGATLLVSLPQNQQYISISDLRKRVANITQSRK